MAKQGQPVISKTRRVFAIIGRVVFVLVLLGLVLVIISMQKAYNAYEDLRDNLEQFADIDVPESSQGSRVYARDYNPSTGEGTLLASLYEQNRQQAEYNEFPAMLVCCVLAMEDSNFFRHNGIDLEGLARAGIRIARRGGTIKGGGSTITQQLSRNVFLPGIRQEKTAERKIQEAILAMAIEKKLTKQEILEAYLNHVYLGAGAHGIKTAARTYFNKDLDELNLAESALIAGLIQAPSLYQPTNEENIKRAKARRNDILELMHTRLDEGFIEQLIIEDPELFSDLNLTHQMIDEAIEEPIVTVQVDSPDHMKAPFFTSFVRDHYLKQRYGLNRIYTQGMTIVTTVDPQIQAWAEEIVKQKIDENRDSKKVTQAAVVVIEVATGEVLAAVGGYEYGDPDDTELGKYRSKYNRAMQGDRPVGSSMKPFTYATAYEQGFDPGTLIWDGPNKEYSKRMGRSWPKNSSGDYLGWISMYYALQRSRNAASVDLIANCTGCEPVIQTARKMGITAYLEPVPALTLGAFDIKPVEMAAAFATFPNMGKHIDYITIKRVYSKEGIVHENNESIEDRSNIALSENTAWTMIQNMRLVVNAGTGTKAQVPGVQIAGKTGTNDDFADAWFVGYSPELVCAVWVGNDNYGEQMRRVFGGHLPAEIFQALMKKIYTKQTETIGEGEDAVEVVIWDPPYKQTEFAQPAGVTFSGFGGAVVGAVLVRDEEGNWVMEELPEEEESEEDSGSEEDSSEDDDSGFYNQWEPPVEVFF